MTLVRLASLVGVALLVLILNIAASVLYMVVYGYLINPGHPKDYYNEHIKVAAPYCSVVAGIPLMFLAGLWAAGWGGGGVGGVGVQLGVKAAVVIWLAYAIIDLGVLLAAGTTKKIAMVCAVSLVTKLAAVCIGAMVATRNAA